MNEPKYQQITYLITVLRTSNQGAKVSAIHLLFAFFRHFNDERKRTLSPQLGIQLFLEYLFQIKQNVKLFHINLFFVNNQNCNS